MKRGKKVADEIGIYFDQEINNRLRGVSRMESFEIILERYNGELNESEKEFWITKKNDIYKELLKKYEHFRLIRGSKSYFGWITCN